MNVLHRQRLFCPRLSNSMSYCASRLRPIPKLLNNGVLITFKFLKSDLLSTVPACRVMNRC